MPRLGVAFDVGPLIGPITGVGAAVLHLKHAIEHRSPEIELLPYLTSFGAPRSADWRRPPFPAGLAHRWWSRNDSPRCDRWLGRPAVVHGTNYVVPPMRRAARLASIHDCWFLEHPKDVTPPVARIASVLRRTVKDGIWVHTLSEATARRTRELLDTDRVATIPLGPIPLAACPPGSASPVPGIEAGESFVLAVSTVERRKNLPRLVAAFAEIGARLPSIRLVIAGSPGNDQPGVDEARAALPPTIARRVLLAGRVDERQKSWLLHHAAVLAYPSLDEGFGFPLLEAMTAATPIVASTAGSIPEVAQDAAVLVAPTDVAGLAHAVVEVLTDDDRRDALLAAGARRLADFDWDDTSERMSALYHRLAQEVGQ